jgi:hypothetical protein
MCINNACRQRLHLYKPADYFIDVCRGLLCIVFGEIFINKYSKPFCDSFLLPLVDGKDWNGGFYFFTKEFNERNIGRRFLNGGVPQFV